MPRRSPEEIIILILCGICMVGLLPFAIIRFERGDLFVGLIDSIGFLGTFLIFIYVYRTRRVAQAGLLLAVFGITGMILNILVMGSRDLNFLYPVVIATYFLTPPRIALAMTGAALLIVSVMLLPGMLLFEYAKFALSLLASMLFAYVFATQRNRQRDLLLQQSIVDPLTGAGNRRALQERLDQMVASHKRNGLAMSVIILDLDNFKDINDIKGHLFGDEALRTVAKTISSRIRASDNIYRYGGDEFIVLAADSNADTATKLAEDIRMLIGQQVASITVSLGVAEYRADESPGEWLMRADRALYRAKQGGKNLVVIEPYSAQFNPASV
jgi:diguanylate cyclase